MATQPLSDGVNEGQGGIVLLISGVDKVFDSAVRVEAPDGPTEKHHVVQPRAIVEVDECVAGVFGLRRHSKERGASLINLGRLVKQSVNLFGEGDESAQLDRVVVEIDLGVGVNAQLVVGRWLIHMGSSPSRRTGREAAMLVRALAGGSRESRWELLMQWAGTVGAHECCAAELAMGTQLEMSTGSGPLWATRKW